MTRIDPRSAAPRAPLRRNELLAAVVDAQASRSGEPIGYQETILEVLRCLDDAELGAIDAVACLDRIHERIAAALPVDPFDRRPAGDRADQTARAVMT